MRKLYKSILTNKEINFRQFMATTKDDCLFLTIDYKNAGYLANHGLTETPENINKGFQLRSKIIQLKEEIDFDKDW